VTAPGASAAELAERIVAGQPAAVARGITRCEAGDAGSEALLAALPPRRAHLVGLTGSPGAGKSTLINALVGLHRARGARVGVVAVDPSSPLSGGALLGDRVRLCGVAGDAGVFFRSLASRGAAGGLSDAARAAGHVLSAAGFDPVLIETVGAGQAEVRVMRVADTVVVVLAPGAGDEVQALKAGIMEIADVFALNKADRPGAAELRRHVKGMLVTRDRAGWRPPVVETVASEGGGVAELAEAVAAHRDLLHGGGGDVRLRASSHAEALRVARSLFDAALDAEAAAVDSAAIDPSAGGAVAELDAGRHLAGAAARRLLDGLRARAR
jgi:LAO/AO transport system kinase